MSGKQTITKTLKFIIKTEKRIEDILNKVTARRTFAVKEYLKIIESEEELIEPETFKAIALLEELTIKTRNRLKVRYDFKELTGLFTVDLQQCARTAITNVSEL